MTEISVENIEPVEQAAEPPDAPDEVPEPPPLERQPVTFESSAGSVSFEAAPKRRGRPKAEPKPKAGPKKRGRPPKPRVEVEEPVYEEPVAPTPQIGINALLAPLMQAYMANSHMQRRQVKAQRNREMVRSIFSRQRAAQNLA